MIRKKANKLVCANKCYVLDTSVLVYDPEALFAFDDSHIIIPALVIEELDQFKTEPEARGRNARQAIRSLDAMRSLGSLGDGVKLENGATLQVLFPPSDYSLPSVFLGKEGDNGILLTAFAIKERGCKVIFVSKDLNARVKADILRVPAEDYLKEHISKDNFYKGWVRLPVPAAQIKTDATPKDLLVFEKDYTFMPHEYILVESANNPDHNRVFRYVAPKNFMPVIEPRTPWNLHARNPQQLMAMDLLFNDDIKLVTLFGGAGTGKTFLSLLVGLYKVLMDDVYKKMLISRPVVPLGRGIGYLPGTVEEKLHSWMLPIFDNMEFILHEVQGAAYQRNSGHLSEGDRHHDRPAGGRSNKRREESRRESHHSHPGYRQDEWHRGSSSSSRSRRSRDREDDHGRHGNGHGNGHGHGGRPKGGLRPLDKLVADGKISLEAITYMRGRSIPYQFILIDEVQNLTPHEVKTLISRVGEGSKIILTGDPYQIDSPYLDFTSNGLVVVSERFKGEKIFGSVYLDKSERSELSQLTSKLL